MAFRLIKNTSGYQGHLEYNIYDDGTLHQVVVDYDHTAADSVNFYFRSAAVIKCYRELKKPIVSNWLLFALGSKYDCLEVLNATYIDSWFKNALPEEMDFPRLVHCLRRRIKCHF